MPSANPYDRGADRLVKEQDAGADGGQASGSFGDTVTHRTLSGDSGTFESPLAGAPQARSRGDLSVLGPTVHFKGELSADEDLMIQGHVEGSIHHSASHLTVGAKGKVKADVHANHIVVQGEVVGDLFANEAVIIEASARVRGNVFAPRVALHEGAKFKGSIDMDGSPEQSAREPKTEAKPAASQARSGRKKSSGSAKDTVSDSEVDELLD